MVPFSSFPVLRVSTLQDIDSKVQVNTKVKVTIRSVCFSYK